MKTVTLAAIVVIGAGLAASPVSAAPINPWLAGISPDQLSNVTQVGQKKWKGHSWKWKHRRRHHDNDFGFGGFSFGFGVPLVAPYYYYDRDVDCIGRWHRHYRRWHCHGQLVYDY